MKKKGKLQGNTSTDNVSICQLSDNKLNEFYSRLYHIKYLHPSLIANSSCPFHHSSEHVLNARVIRGFSMLRVRMHENHVQNKKVLPLLL